MVMKQKITGRASTIPVGLGSGAAVSLGITIISVTVIAKLVSAEYLEESKIGYCVMVMLMAASYGGAEMAVKRIKRQRLMVCMLSGLLYFGMLLGMTALFFGGQYEAVGVTGILVIGGAFLAVLSGGRGRNGRRTKKRNC